MDNPKRARSWKRRIQPRVNLRIVEPVLYSTLFLLLASETFLTNLKKNQRRSVHQCAALDVDRLPGDEVAVVGSEKDHRADQVLRKLVALEAATLLSVQALL